MATAWSTSPCCRATCRRDRAGALRGLDKIRGPLPGSRNRPDGVQSRGRRAAGPASTCLSSASDLTPRALRVPEGAVRHHPERGGHRREVSEWPCTMCRSLGSFAPCSETRRSRGEVLLEGARVRLVRRRRAGATRPVRAQVRYRRGAPFRSLVRRVLIGSYKGAPHSARTARACAIPSRRAATSPG